MLNYSVIISVFFLFSCAQKSNPEKGFTLSGNTQGTTYTIIIAEDTINFQQEEITNLLAEFDTVLSSYIPVSEISRLNRSEAAYSFSDPYHFFKECYELSQEVYKNSNGLFDPSVYSLVKDWGFFDKNGHVPSDKAIDSILQFTGFENQKYHMVLFDADSVRFLKKDTRFQLDFNAIAQGYSVDVLANFIEKRGHRNYYIEIGGELRLKGKNREGENWKIGIDIPDELPDREIISTLSVSNCGLATSGNYRNYFEKDGKKYGHILSPLTGRPTVTDVLSATVKHKNAALADAYATVFMLLGKQKGIEFLSKNKEIEVLLVYLDEKNNMQVFSTMNQSK